MQGGYGRRPFSRGDGEDDPRLPPECPLEAVPERIFCIVLPEGISGERFTESGIGVGKVVTGTWGHSGGAHGWILK